MSQKRPALVAHFSIVLIFAYIFMGFVSFGAAQTAAAASSEEAPEETAKEQPAEEEEEEKPSEEELENPPMALSQGTTGEPDIEWDKRQQISAELEVDDVNLLGDSIDPHTGSLSFEHTDVVLPGNSGLEVAFRRQRLQGFPYDRFTYVELGDWQIVKPHMRVTISGAVEATQQTGSPLWHPDRCSAPYSQTLPTVTVTSGSIPVGQVSFDSLGPHEYSSGVMVDVPGYGAQQVLENPSGAHWPAGADKVTTGNWYFTCINEVGAANGGGEGFYGYAPNGDRYRFDKLVLRQDNDLGSIPIGASDTRYVTLIMATEVTDVHGNWVKYDYDSSGRLTKIHANDGRRIDVLYNGASLLVDEVVANPGTSDERSWQYSYGTSQVQMYPAQNIWINYSQTLQSVTLPDGRDWSFNLAGMSSPIIQGEASTDCVQATQTVTITHPNGVTGSFVLNERRHRRRYEAVSTKGVCPGDDAPTYPQYVAYYFSMTVDSKTLSGPGYPSATWTFAYESDGQDASTPEGDRTNWTRMTDPEGKITTFYHRWSHDPLGGKLMKVETREGSPSSTPVQITENTYIQEAGVGATFLGYGGSDDGSKHVKPTHLHETTVTRGSDVYNTENTYDTNHASSTYSFGKPTKVEEWSNIQSGVRVADITYINRKPVWNMALTREVTRNGVLFDKYYYNTEGQPHRHDRFGTQWRRFSYHTSSGQQGALDWIEDANGDKAYFTSYKRGIPQHVTRKDSEIITRTVDDNGWVTSETDAENNTTYYDYNDAGWLTEIDPPGAYASTYITYLGLGGSFQQVATRGQLETKTWYDSLSRPYRTRQRALATGGSIYVKTAYDALGRTTFVSFPSTVYDEIYGTETEYDALDRPVSVEENVSPYAETTHEYLSQNRTRTTDPSLAQTTSWNSGYGSPDDGDVVKVEDAMGGTTTMTRDIYGKITQLSQSGTQYGYTASVDRYFWYDSRQRLCRHRAPEMGDEVFSYDGLDRLRYEASGQSAGSGCITPPAADRIAYTYDKLDNITLVDYPSGTDDIATVYDDNSNPVSVTRGGIVWTYVYDALDQMTREKLVIDGRTYQFDYDINTLGDIISRTRAGGTSFNYAPDNHGRPRRVRVGSTDYLANGAYHPNGTVTDLDYANGHVLDQNLYTRGLVSLLRHGSGGSSNIVRLEYDYDDRSKVEDIDDGVVAGADRSFTYDDNGRLASATGSWGTSSYKYDALNNIRERTIGSRVVGIAYDANNRVDDVTDTANPLRSFAHDARGNVTNDGRYAFVYDMADQPVSMTGTGVSAAYAYDGNKKRVKSVVGGKTVYHVYSALTGGLIFKDEVTDAKTTDYANIGPAGVRLENGTTPVYTHADHLGSPVAATDAAGALLWRESYLPFGETLNLDGGANDNNTGFTGHVEDAATGLTYMQARYYDPVIGRFYSTDPIDYQDQLNLYAYVGNDPVNAIDPTGEDTVAVGVEVDFFVGAVGGGAGAGVFINYDQGKLRVGTYTSTKKGAGIDIGVSVTAHYTPGSVSDFSGTSIGGELDVGPHLTFENGVTLDSNGSVTRDSKHIVGFELGVGLPEGGISAAQTDVNANTLLTVDVGGIASDLTEAGARAAGDALREGAKQVVTDKVREAVDDTFKEH